MSIARQYGHYVDPVGRAKEPKPDKQPPTLSDVLALRDAEIADLKAELELFKGMLADANKMLIGNAVTSGNAVIMDPVTLTAISVTHDVTQDDIIERRKAQTAERVRKYREKRRNAGA